MSNRKRAKKRKRDGGSAADKRISDAKSNDPLSDVSAVNANNANDESGIQEIFEADGGPTFPCERVTPPQVERRGSNPTRREISRRTTARKTRIAWLALLPKARE